MKQYIFVGLLMVCVGCGCESLTSGPSPLETFDQDRLYVLINAAVSRGRGAECARYFQEADDQAPRNPDEVFMRAALSQVCPESMVKIAAYLEHNGVAGVKPAHVKDVAFWERMQAQAVVEGERARQEREQERQARRGALPVRGGGHRGAAPPDRGRGGDVYDPRLGPLRPGARPLSGRHRHGSERLVSAAGLGAGVPALLDYVRTPGKPSSHGGARPMGG